MGGFRVTHGLPTDLPKSVQFPIAKCYIHLFVWTYIVWLVKYVNIYINICIYTYIYICRYIYIYTHTYTHIHAHRSSVCTPFPKLAPLVCLNIDVHIAVMLSGGFSQMASSCWGTSPKTWPLMRYINHNPLHCASCDDGETSITMFNSKLLVITRGYFNILQFYPVPM